MRVKFHTSSDTAGTTAVSVAANDGISANYHCPVLYKPFTNNSHVVAIKTTGNVFSYEVSIALKRILWCSQFIS